MSTEQIQAELRSIIVAIAIIQARCRALSVAMETNFAIHSSRPNASGCVMDVANLDLLDAAKQLTKVQEALP